jgi:hypothetical protein
LTIHNDRALNALIVIKVEIVLMLLIVTSDRRQRGVCISSVVRYPHGMLRDGDKIGDARSVLSWRTIKRTVFVSRETFAISTTRSSASISARRQRDDVGTEIAWLPTDHIRFAAAVQFCRLITSREGALDRFQISRIGSIDQPARRRQSGAPL